MLQKSNNQKSDDASTRWIATKDGKTLFHATNGGRLNEPHIFIGHTQATHSGHYTDITTALNERGWTVTRGDLRGHGHSTGSGQPLVHLDAEKGWGDLKSDLRAMLDKSFDGVPFNQRVIAAQNITALLVLELLKDDPDLAGHICLTLPANQRAIIALSKIWIKARMKFRPKAEPDPQTHHHLYSFLANRLKNCSHIADVMSADKELVSTILADEKGFPIPTLSYWSAIFDGYQSAWNLPKAIKINPDSRFLLLYGDEDPLIANGGFAQPVMEHLRKLGAQDIELKIVPGGRTAILLDERTLSVSDALADWLNKDSSNQKEHIHSPVASPVTMENISEQALEHLGWDEGIDPLDTSALIALCYDAIDDETRWVELLYRVALSLSRQDESELATLESTFLALMPHWDRSFKINRQLMNNAALGVVLQSVIDQLDIGTALVSHNMTILYNNNAFAKALVGAVSEEETPDLNRHLDEIADVSFKSAVANGTNHVVLMSGNHPLGFYFQPDALAQSSGSDDAPSGLLILRSQEKQDRSSQATRISMLELAYGMTPQEAAVALEIANGQSPAAIGENLEVSINTVRTHLKRGYEKMNVDGQTEMAARILSGPIGWLSQ